MARRKTSGEIAAEAYARQVLDLLRAFEENIGEPIDAHVLGEPVQVDCYGNEGERRGLTAVVKKDGATWSISLADVEFPPDSTEAKLVDSYRELLGLKPIARTKPVSKKRHKVEIEDVVVGEPIDVAVLAVKQNATRVRILKTGREITLRSALSAVPGEIATVVPSKVWTFNKHPYLSGEAKDIRLDVAALGLTPLKLEAVGTWKPREHYWGEKGQPLEDWARPIYEFGPRPQFVLEDVVPGDSPTIVENGIEMTWDGPIVEAIEAHQQGDVEGGYKALEDLLSQDLRCLDAHAHLANFTFDHLPRLALRHYRVGVEIVKQSLPAGFNGVLPWGRFENRPYLRCLHGYGLCLWRVGQTKEALAVFEQMLWLNPTDNQGVRELREDLRAGRDWKDVSAAEAAECPF